MEHADEVVYVVWTMAAGIQSLSQGEERLGVVGEVVNVENGLRIWDVILLQVGIETRSWSPENNTFCFLWKISLRQTTLTGFKAEIV